MANSKEIVSKKIQVEITTPHRLSVAILIRSFCDFRNSEEFKSIENEAAKCKYRSDFCVLIIKLLQSPDLSLEELNNLIGSLKCNFSREIEQVFMNSFHDALSALHEGGTGHMLDAIDSISRVVNFNENSPPDPNKCYISKSSVIGFYLRRLIVNFEKLTFSEVTTVYLAFQRYYKQWMNRSKSTFTQHHKDMDTPSEINLESMKLCESDIHDNGTSNREQWSKRQAEFFIATQAALLTNNPEKALPPPELQNRLSSLLKSNTNISEAHFLSYLNNLRVKEFCGAVDNLYQSFDKFSSMEGKSYEEKTKGYRFAALNLAILYFHFGHKEEAMCAFKEAIKTSQEANDNVCLEQALTWWFRLSETSTNSDNDNLILHSISSAEINSTYTTSLGIQYNCLMFMAPLFIYESLPRLDVINCQQIHTDLISNSYAIRAAIWQFYGKTDMSCLWSQLLLHLNIDCTSPNKSYYGEGFCLAICNVANQLLLKGHYNSVYAIHQFAKTAFPKEPHSHIWMLHEFIALFLRSLYNEKWLEAESAAQRIIVIDKWEGLLRLTELYLHQEDFTEAHNCVMQIIENNKETERKNMSKFNYYVRAKILLAEIHIASSLPDKVPPEILNTLNECLADPDIENMNYYSALILLHVANIHLSLGLTGQALKVLEQCLIQILAHGGCYDRARAMLLFVKCLIAHSRRLEEAERLKVIEEAVSLLDEVKSNFEKVEAVTRQKDVLFLQAHLYDYLEKETERNKCSLEYRLLEEENPSKNVNMLVKYL